MAKDKDAAFRYLVWGGFVVLVIALCIYTVSAERNNYKELIREAVIEALIEYDADQCCR